MNFEIQDAPKGAEERLRKLVSAMKEIGKTAKRSYCYGNNSMRKAELHRQIDVAAILQNIESRRGSYK